MSRGGLRALAGIGLLLLAVALAARGAAPVGAAPLPTFATPKTAHLALDLAMSGSDQATGDSYAITARGEGDVDTARQAAQFAYELRIPADAGRGAGLPETMMIEMVLLDGRLYARESQSGPWTWTDAPPGTADAFLFQPELGLWGADRADFVRVGPEVVNGAATTRWRAEIDLAALFAGFADPSPAPRGATPTPTPAMVMAYDLWIGDADRYVHRQASGMRFAIPEDNGSGGEFAYTMTQTYSKFDQPVRIVAPAGATRAANGGGAPPSLGGLPLGGSTFAPPGAGNSLAGGFPGAGTLALGGRGAADPSPTPATSPTPRATATQTPRPTPTPTARPTQPAAPSPQPTATVGVAANVAAPPSAAPAQVAPSSAAPAPATPRARPAPTDNRPLVLGTAALLALLALAGGLIVLGRRGMQ